MATWGQILSELHESAQANAGPPNFDAVRRKYLVELHRLAGSPQHTVTIVEAVLPTTRHCCPNQAGWTPQDRLYPFDASGAGDYTAAGWVQCGQCGTLQGPAAWELLIDATDAEITATSIRVAETAREVVEGWRAEIIDRLERDLADIDPADIDGLPELDQMMTPGIGRRSDGAIVAWTVDPLDTGDCLDIIEAEREVSPR